jgi:hypothetical protein
MSRPRIELDFARHRRRLNKMGVVLLAIGMLGVALVVADYRSVAAESQGVELKLTALSPTDADLGLTGKAAAKTLDEAGAAVAELATPWSLLLHDLEVAAKDSEGSVALLGVEPDREKRQVRISAEARNLPLALAYVQRLQRSHALRYPMLANHEVQSKDPEHPVRFDIKADWKLAP